MATVNEGVAPISDYTLGVSQVRLLLGDTDATSVSQGVGTYLFFSDAELSAILSLYNNDPRRSAARCLQIIAASQVLLLKVYSQDDLAVQGDRISEALRKTAADLIAQADDADATAAADFFDTADPFPQFPYYEGNQNYIYYLPVVFPLVTS